MTTKTCILATLVTSALLVAPQLVRAGSGIQRKWPSPNGDLETVGQESVVQYASHALIFQVRESTNPNSYPNVILDVFSYPMSSCSARAGGPPRQAMQRFRFQHQRPTGSSR